jgi:hypothetical protein
MSDPMTKVRRILLRGAYVAATIAALGCGGALHEQRPLGAATDDAHVASDSEEPIELRVTREELSRGRDYVDAVNAGRAAGAAARRAAEARQGVVGTSR